MPKSGESCALCGVRHQDANSALVHKLVAHGPLKGRLPRKKKRIAASLLAKFHSRLEQAGFDELQSHQAIQILAEELCEAGIV